MQEVGGEMLRAFSPCSLCRVGDINNDLSYHISLLRTMSTMYHCNSSVPVNLKRIKGLKSLPKDKSPLLSMLSLIVLGIEIKLVVELSAFFFLGCSASL